MSRNPLNANELYDEDFAAGRMKMKSCLMRNSWQRRANLTIPAWTLSSCRVSASVSWMLLSFILVR